MKTELNKLDAVDFLSGNQKFEISSNTDASLYMIGSEKSQSMDCKKLIFLIF